MILKDPELIKEVLSNKQGHIGMPPMNPLILILSKGLSTLDGEDWFRHRNIIAPAFHTEKIKVFIFNFQNQHFYDTELRFFIFFWLLLFLTGDDTGSFRNLFPVNRKMEENKFSYRNL